MTFTYDVVVVGAGHAGAEAAVAAARLGANTCLITMDMNRICQMSCNPAIGGLAKGQIVREIDALGGMMGIVTDSTALQFRLLNSGKGPAVWSPRSQCDRQQYILRWREVLDSTDGLSIWQDQVSELLVSQDKRVLGVRTILGVEFHAPQVILTCGTFLRGLMHIGGVQISGGRCAEPAVESLTESLTRHGIRSARMKTGTPVRIDRRSVDFSLIEAQQGDASLSQFSFLPSERSLPQLPCWTLYTNAECHSVLRRALSESPLYNGQIRSIGPRYCPSIENKLVTFADRDRHPLFLEPEGLSTNEMYLNGFSSSMPVDVQIRALQQIPALRNVRVYRPGYAIEYDYFDPTQLSHSLESRIVSGLYLAGQVNGTTGYEEAACQGLMAGINAARRLSGKEPFVLRRDEAYIGVLIDDLVTKGVDEPYRMFTSRAEYRILLRQDNADSRLTERGFSLGLATQERLDWWLQKKEALSRLLHFCQSTKVTPPDGTQRLSLIELISRPQLSLTQVASFCPPLADELSRLPNRREEIAFSLETSVKYSGYAQRERQAAQRMHRLEDVRLPSHLDYSKLLEISTEGREKLSRIRPTTLAQASRIPGVSPSDVNVLLVLLGRASS